MGYSIITTDISNINQSWNIDAGSAFRNLDAKDIEPVSLDNILSAFKEK